MALLHVVKRYQPAEVTPPPNACALLCCLAKPAYVRAVPACVMFEACSKCYQVVVSLVLEERRVVILHGFHRVAH